VFAATRRAADLHPGVLLPHRPELGQPRLFPKADRSLPPAKCWASSSRSSTTTSRAALILLSHEVDRPELLAEALSTEGRRKVEISRAAARREEGPRRARAAECARGAGPAARRNLVAGALLDGLPRLSTCRACRAHRGLRQQPHHGHQRGRRDDRRRAGRLRQNQYRKFNIRSTDITPGDDYGMMREVLTRRFKRLADLGPAVVLARPSMLDPIADKLLVAACLLILAADEPRSAAGRCWAAVVISVPRGAGVGPARISRRTSASACR
jgi:hypothetical protein